jgi:tetratricopeptide (TPR) repeat protein
VPRVTLFLALAGSLYAFGQAYDISGRILPETPAAVSVFGTTTPFHAETTADERGRFHIRSLAPGPYTVAVFIPGRGELRQTVELGPTTATAQGLVELTIHFDDSLVSGEGIARNAKVSTRELSIPPNARREFEKAQSRLAHRDVPAAVTHLEKAVQIAPQFTDAWNNLGTIAYQSRQYAQADHYFRKALEENPGAYEPSVNLGGVLLNEGKPDEALAYNRYSVLSRPNDALANSQLGMTYAALGQLDLGQKYLEAAKRIDPTHFSYPQLSLARIHLLRNERTAAAEEFRDFLRRHPDASEAAAVRAQLASVQ